MLRDTQFDPFETIWYIFRWAIDWLTDWRFHGVPILFYLIGLALLAIILDFVFN